MSEESKDPNPKSSWQQLARHVAGKINTAWWLEKLGLPLVLAALGLSCAILIARREYAEVPWLNISLGGTVLLALIAGLAWVLARRHFETPEQAMVRIEATMKLRNALSAARAGVAPWPDAPKSVDDGTHWHWPRLLTPVAASLLFLAASLFLPVSARTNDPRDATDQPQAWKDLEADIEQLAEDNTVQEEYLKELEERIKELKNQDEEDWYDHSSLEATDALKKSHDAEVENIERNLRRAERALNTLQKNGGKLSDGQKERLLDEFDDAMNKMKNGAMKPNKELLEQLGDIDPGNLGNLTPEQLDQLRENMREAAEKMEGLGEGEPGQGQGEGQGKDWLDEMLEENPQAGEQPGQGQPGPGNPGPGNPGNGGLDRGPGTAPGVLGQPGGDVETGKMEGLEAEDLSRTLPGDLLEVLDGEHEVEREDTGIREGGGIRDGGKGGDRVWRDALLPDEKKALKEFFE